MSSLFKDPPVNPEDHLPEPWKVLEKTIRHTQGKLTGSQVKKLYEATTYLLAVYADNDMCVCDGGDSSVGMPPTTCEAHMLAYIVEDVIYSQRSRKLSSAALATAKG